MDIIGFIGIEYGKYIFMGKDAYDELYISRCDYLELDYVLPKPFDEIPVIDIKYSIIIDEINYGDIRDVCVGDILYVLYETKNEIFVRAHGKDFRHSILFKDAYKYSVVYTDDNLEFIEGL